MRRTGFSRLAQLYGKMERQRATELQVASQHVVEVERRIGHQMELRAAALRAGRVAMASESESAFESDAHLQWLFAENEAHRAAYRVDRLEQVLQERNADRSLAAEEHRISRTDKEQVQRLLEQEAVQAATLETRREQAIADDRFLARLRWLELRVRGRNSGSA